MLEVIPERPALDAACEQIHVQRVRYPPATICTHRPLSHLLISLQLSAATEIVRQAGGRVLTSRRGPGRLSITPVGQAAAWSAAEGADMAQVFLPQALLVELARSVFRRDLAADSLEIEDPIDLDDPLLYCLVRNLVEGMAAQLPGIQLLAATGGQHLAAHVLVHYSRIRPPPPPRSGCLAPWQLRRIVQYLDDNLARNVTLAECAELLQLNSFHFARAFARSTGLPPHRWLMQRRMEHARDLLRKSEHSLAEIADTVGCADQSHFSRLFRRHFGISPRSYRQQH